MIVSLCHSLLQETTWFGLQALKNQFQHRLLKVILPSPWRTPVTVQVSLDLPHNTWFTVLSWRRDKEMLLQHRMKKSSRKVRHCLFHVLCPSQHKRNSRRHDRRCSSKESSWVRVTELVTSRNQARSQFSTFFPFVDKP